MTFDSNVFMNKMTTLSSITIPRWYRVLAVMMVAFMIVTGANAVLRALAANSTSFRCG